MKKLWRSSKILVAVVVVVCLIAVGCAKVEEKQVIRITELDYPCGIAVGTLMKIVVEDELGYPVEMPAMKAAVAMAGIQAGDVDVEPDIWLPQQEGQIEKYVKAGVMVMLGPSYADCPQGWLVPTYVAEEHGITNVNQLNDNAALFDEDGDGRGEIYIGPAGWTATEVDQIKIKSYGLNYDWHSQDEWALYALVRGKIEKHEPILFYAYSPHWLFIKWDLTWIEEPAYSDDLWDYKLGDPEGSFIACEWNPASVNIGVRSALKDEAPDVYKFLQNFKITKDALNFLVMEIEEVGGNPKQDPIEVCRKWIGDHPDVLAQWLAGIK